VTNFNGFGFRQRHLCHNDEQNSTRHDTLLWKIPPVLDLKKTQTLAKERRRLNIEVQTNGLMIFCHDVAVNGQKSMDDKLTATAFRLRTITNYLTRMAAFCDEETANDPDLESKRRHK